MNKNINIIIIMNKNNFINANENRKESEKEIAKPGSDWTVAD